MAPILEVHNVTKRFPGVLANDRVGFSLEEGEVLAFLGENGAGKSTLMNILYGLYAPDEGEVRIHGEKVDIQDPNDAIRLGIGMVHQHFQLVPVFSVAENIVMGTEPTGLAVSWKGLGLAVGVTAVLGFVGGLFAKYTLVHCFLAAGIGAVALAAAYALFLGLGLLSRRGLRIYFPIVALSSAALFTGAALALAKAPNIAGQIGLALLYTAIAAALVEGWRWLRGMVAQQRPRLNELVVVLGILGVLAAVVVGLRPGGKLLYVFLALLFAAASFAMVDVISTALDRRAAARRIRALSKQYGLEVDPMALTGSLPVGIQQRVEIVKTLYREAKILILDEPTAVLTPQETDELFTIMRSLVEQGKSILFISHKLKEVMTIADRIIVLRDGRVVGETRPAVTSESQLAEMMVGREVMLVVSKGPASPGEVVLEVSGLTALDKRHQPALRGVDFFVRGGEVLGVAGVQGNGQTELVEVLTGLHTATGGSVRILGHDVANCPPREITELGVAHIPEDRQRDGLVLPFPIYDNLILCNYYEQPFAQGVSVQFDAIHHFADRVVEEFDVRTPSIALPAQNLSGGNQQKVIVARELSRPIKLLIASQPTRGLDVGSIEYIHQRLVQKRDEGCAVLLVSTELDEIMAVSDRIAVMYEGHIVGTVDADKVSREELGLLMAGARPESWAEEVRVG